ncbi:branched-chain amino acid ABC transporter permease [Actinoplanes sp. NBRC 103695]|uniref:branched-chain amino acid ABC transporter permease n=1 Tax=Actinoplanes sp. NBRC 103695 TaxID=3032202 RepID=UPI0024A0D31F|nr:branched-chain amino acid ABC transporter permease [Actinoplanes sp. NBRC 103695]GLZ00768.1 branched-chain amino acid ABC transporter permease [Actinoplanes sp. NBRC 103695]
MGSTSATVAVTGLGGLAYGLLLFVVAAGLKLILGVMKVMNLAHGASYLAGTWLAYLFADGTLTGLALALAAGLAAATVGGAGLAALLRPLAGHTEQAVVTLGLGGIIAWLFSRISGGSSLTVPRPGLLDGHLSFAGHGYPIYHLAFIAVAALIAVAMHQVLHRSMAGIALRAAIDDPPIAATLGLSATRIRIAAITVGTALAVGAGVLGAPVLGPAPGVDATVLTLSLIVVILGGAGTNIRALLIAALVVGMVNYVGAVVAPGLASFSLFLVVIAVLVVRRQGLRTAVAA